jgi:hypothetical protein
MATVFGESHALGSFLRAVHCIDSRMVVSDLAEFDRLLIARRIRLLQQRQTLPAEIVIEAAQRMRDLERDESVQVLKLTTSGDLFAERTTGALAQVTALRMRSGLFFRRWLWRMQASWLQARLARLRRNNAREHSQALLSWRQSREMLLRLQADPEGCAQRRMEYEFGVFESLVAVGKSPVAESARGELAVIGALRRLPDNFILLNSLKLKSNEFVRREGRRLLPEQVDHVVIGPTGIFIVESRSWSRGIVQAGGGSDALAQIGRAGHLCRMLLTAARLPAAVCSVIACSAPPSEEPLANTFAVVPPDRLDEFVRAKRPEWFLARREIEVIREFLGRYLLSREAAAPRIRRALSEGAWPAVQLRCPQ